MQKLFTVEEANATLPLVRRIVQDVVSQYARWEELARELERMASEMQTPEEALKLTQLERRVQVAAAEVESFQRELTSLGISLKDPRTGLVDFPAMFGSRMVWLCWIVSEPAVAHWHEWDAGFGGRQPLVPTLVA